MKRLVIDPVTRVFGPLRLEADVVNGRVKSAYLSGTMVRGVESILEGRDPREAWAFTQRICGVCGVAHAVASVRAVEDALHVKVPRSASLVRKLMIGTSFLQNHATHFYHLQSLDWINPIHALNADPEKTSEFARTVSDYEKSTPSYFKELQNRIRTQIENGQQGLFSGGYWEHPEYRLPPEVSLLILTHYMEAINWQAQVVQVHTIFGGKSPHPNFVVGGMPSPIDLQSDTAVNLERLNRVKTIIDQMVNFVEKVYLQDVLAICMFYKDWFNIGEETGNFLVLGEPEGDSYKEGKFFMPPTFIRKGDLKTYEDVDYTKIEEFVTHSWYAYGKGDEVGLHPYQGETVLNYTGPEPPYKTLKVDGKYSWIKAPRYKGLPSEVGPLARVLSLYARNAHGVREMVDGALSKLELPIQALFSTMGRTLARALEAIVYARAMEEWYRELMDRVRSDDGKVFNSEKWEASKLSGEAKGLGLVEAPGGSLSHWVYIKGGSIANYQIISPSTWNCSPRDAKNQPSPCEASLVGHSVAILEEPLEVLRTLHSFDLCPSCASHLYETKSNRLSPFTGEFHT